MAFKFRGEALGFDVDVPIRPAGRTPPGAPPVLPGAIDAFAVKARRQIMGLIGDEGLPLPAELRQELRERTIRLFEAGALTPLALQRILLEINNALDGAGRPPIPPPPEPGSPPPLSREELPPPPRSGSLKIKGRVV